ncbi:alanine dehydrogenase [Cohnella sp. JJ-181]|uniref:alanine dehydrogenase n=1 Tax=Cohnella rhizoplanae TaxID=2974897 RepID=UPI0022FFC1E4|nr:alanine dehydrogenase [Cohnella sp. JJ-181]CAI6062237.1 Alanine dehydrogenase [Cohnella sp. JJ-181]
MQIGVVKELKENEYRVAIVPSGVVELIRNGHEVYIERDAGLGSGYSDHDYAEAGATIVAKAEDIWGNVDLLYKVKEVFPEEFKYLRDDLIVFAYLHSNAYKEQTAALIASGCTSIAYEDISNDQGEWPLLSPMSELAGKGGFLAALHFAQTINGGSGKLLANVCGVPAPTITIIGCGHSGRGACELAAAFGNRVNMLDINYDAMLAAKEIMPKNVSFVFSNRANLVQCLKESDVILNCILWPKTRKDHLIYREDLKLMKPGAMIIDVACDDAGAVETSRSTSHQDPVYYEEGILHYCVDNIPSAFAQTASITLSNATLPFALAIANKGVRQALKDDKHLRRGLTTYGGKLTLLETAVKLGLEFTSPDELAYEF